MTILAINDDTDLDDATPTEISRRLWTEIENSEKAFEDYFSRCRKINKRYLDERTSEAQQDERRFNILWSNIQTIQPAVYSQTPKPEIERRWKDQDPVGRAASQLLERAATYSLQCDDFDTLMASSTLDYLLFARAVGWTRYKPYFKPMAPAPDALPKTGLTEGADPASTASPDANNSADGSDETQEAPDDLSEQDGADEELAYEEAPAEYIHREDFLHSIARHWNEVWWVARKVYLTRKECIDRFGAEIGQQIALDSFPSSVTQEQQKNGKYNYMKKAKIYELWCKTNRKIYWLGKGYNQGPLDTKEDWLKLKDFFPCPRPAFGTLGNDTLIPVPDYIEYQDQADELDDLSQRIKMLSKALKVVGVYDASAQGLKNFLEEGHDNTLIPVEGWALHKDKGGNAGTIDWFPVEQVIKVLMQLFQAREACKQEIYEITGYSDIMRGASDAAETATAQQIKSQFGSMRLRQKQKEIQRFARDIVALKSEIIAEHFSPDTLMLMSNLQLPNKPTPEQLAQMQQAQAQGMQVPPPPEGPYIEDVIGLLRNDGLRGFRIDIETDSTIFADQQQEKTLRTEFLQATGAFLASAIPLSEQVPQIAPLLGELLMFGIRGFGGSTRQLEQPFEDALAKMQQASQQPPSPPPPDPAVQTAQINQQTDQAKAQSQQEIEQMKLDHAAQQADLQRGHDMAKHKMTLANATGDAAIPAPGDMQAQQMAQSQQTSDALAQALQMLAATTQSIQLALQGINAPKQMVVQRGPDGKVTGAQQIPMVMQ